VKRAAQPAGILKPATGRVVETDHDRVAHSGFATLSTTSPLTVPCVSGSEVEEHYRKNNCRVLESMTTGGRHSRRRRTNFAINEKGPRWREG